MVIVERPRCGCMHILQLERIMQEEQDLQFFPLAMKTPFITVRPKIGTTHRPANKIRCHVQAIIYFPYRPRGGLGVFRTWCYR